MIPAEPLSLRQSLHQRLAELEPLEAQYWQQLQASYAVTAQLRDSWKEVYDEIQWIKREVLG